MPAGPADTIAGYQVMHAIRIAIIDQEGRVRGTYQATEFEAMEALRTDLRRLIKEGSSSSQPLCKGGSVWPGPRTVNTRGSGCARSRYA